MAWAGNIINHIIGMILIQIWTYVGMLLGIFGMWQMGLDGVIGTYDSFKAPLVEDTYMNDMTYEE